MDTIPRAYLSDVQIKVSPSCLPTFGNDLVDGLGIGCKNGDYPCPQLPEEDWTQRGKRGSGALPRVGMQKLFKGKQCSGSI